MYAIRSYYGDLAAGDPGQIADDTFDFGNFLFFEPAFQVRFHNEYSVGLSDRVPHRPEQYPDCSSARLQSVQRGVRFFSHRVVVKIIPFLAPEQQYPLGGIFRKILLNQNTMAITLCMSVRNNFV